MSTLEIVLYAVIGVGVATYVIASIYDLKHPEKKEARKQAKLEKKLAKKQTEGVTTEEEEQDEE